MCIYGPTPDPASATILSRPRRSGVPDVFRKTIYFLAKQCLTPDPQIQTPGAAQVILKILPSSSEGIIPHIQVTDQNDDTDMFLKSTTTKKQQDFISKSTNKNSSENTPQGGTCMRNAQATASS